MNKRNTKRGFTITELVIVIVVIAILAAVLIPTFASLIKKANLSADTQTAKSMNDALAAAEAEAPVASFSDALAAIRGAGYIVGNMNPTKGENYFVWESDSNQILLVNKEMEKILFKAKDLKEEYATIAGGTWYIALNDTSVLEGIEGAKVVPSMTEKAIAGKGDNVKALLKDGGTVTLSENISITTAPAHATAGKLDGIRINTANGNETTLDLNGQTMSATFNTADYRVFQVATDFNLANGTITAAGEAKVGGLWGVLRTWGDAKVNVKNMQISYTNTKAGSEKPGGVFSITENSELLLEDSTIIVGNSSGMEIAATATLKNVTLKSAGERGWCTAGMSVSYGGTLNIESGYYEAQDDVLYVLPTGGTINVKGGTFVGDLVIHQMNAGTTGKIVISGGTFDGKPHSSYTAAQWAELVEGADASNISISNGVVTIVVNG